MSKTDLPDRASLEFLRKLAKDRLREMRRIDPGARLSAAQLAVAREYGFTSWRALKAEVDKRRAPDADPFFVACFTGDLEMLREMLRREPSLVKERGPGGTTALHAALRHPDAMRLLLEHGADPNARDVGDNALPLHFAAGYGPIESVRVLLDAGSDVHGAGDLHAMDVIGWATIFAEPRRDVVDLLVERGARHNIFSAIALGDPDLVQRIVESDPGALARRLSRHEQEQTALHYVIAPADGLVGGTFRTGDHYRTLERLISLGAELEATDARGRTPLEVAMLRGDVEAMRLLHAAGAREPQAAPPAGPTGFAALRKSIRDLRPMVAVPDVAATVAWYQAIGFELTGSHGDGGTLDFAAVSLGGTEVMFVPAGETWRGPARGVSLWFETDRIDDWYATLKRLQLARARAVLEGRPMEGPELRFTGDLYTAFYGQREFGLRDPNGVEVMFAQPVE